MSITDLIAIIGYSITIFSAVIRVGSYISTKNDWTKSITSSNHFSYSYIIISFIIPVIMIILLDLLDLLVLALIVQLVQEC